MKKLTWVLSTLGLAGALLAGCAATQPAVTGGVPAGPSAPAWVSSGEVEGAVSAVGIAPKSKAGPGYQREQALANARVQLAKRIETKVQTSLTNFVQTTGMGDAETVDAVGKTVTKELAKQTLSGTTQKGMYVDPNDGTMYVLVAIDPATAEIAKKQATQSAATSLNNLNAQWQLFQNKKAMEELEKDMKEAFGGQ